MKKLDRPSSISKVSGLLQVICPEARLKILLDIGAGEACVCHLEASLGYRQAYISQQLMALREAGLLGTRREGKYIFYRLEKPEVLEMVQLAARMAGLEASTVAVSTNIKRAPCECPNCSSRKE